MSQPKLAEEVGVSPKTIWSLERGIGSYETAMKVVTHFEKLGVTFLPPDGDEGWGMRDKNETRSFDDLRPKKKRKNHVRKDSVGSKIQSESEES